MGQPQETEPVLLELSCYSQLVGDLTEYAQAGGYSLETVVTQALALLGLFLEELSAGHQLGFVLGAQAIELLKYYGVEEKPRFRPLRLNQLGKNINDTEERLPIKVAADAAAAYRAYKEREPAVKDALVLARASVLLFFAARGELVSAHPFGELHFISLAEDWQDCGHEECQRIREREKAQRS